MPGAKFLSAAFIRCCVKMLCHPKPGWLHAAFMLAWAVDVDPVCALEVLWTVDSFFKCFLSVDVSGRARRHTQPPQAFSRAACGGRGWLGVLGRVCRVGMQVRGFILWAGMLITCSCAASTLSSVCVRVCVCDNVCVYDNVCVCVCIFGTP
jgi:hypothetical protein